MHYLMFFCYQMDDEGNVTNSAYQLNRSSCSSLVEKYTLIPDGTPVKVKLPPSVDTTPTGKKLPPLDSKEFPLNAARLEYMPNQLNTPTGSVTGSIAGSSIRSDMSRIRYEAESPDELALVRAASTYNCCLKGRSANRVTVWLPGKCTVFYLQQYGMGREVLEGLRLKVKDGSGFECLQVDAS